MITISGWDPHWPSRKANNSQPHSAAGGTPCLLCCLARGAGTPQKQALQAIPHQGPMFPADAGIPASSMAAQAASGGLPASQKTLQGHEDAYSGLILDPDSLPESPEEFSAVLAASLDAWRQHGYRGIWLKVPRQRAHLVGHAVDAGFEFHHAERVRQGRGPRGRQATKGSGGRRVQCCYKSAVLFSTVVWRCEVRIAVLAMLQGS